MIWLRILLLLFAKDWFLSRTAYPKWKWKWRWKNWIERRIKRKFTWSRNCFWCYQASRLAISSHPYSHLHRHPVWVHGTALIISLYIYGFSNLMYVLSAFPWSCSKIPANQFWSRISILYTFFPHDMGLHGIQSVWFYWSYGVGSFYSKR